MPPVLLQVDPNQEDIVILINADDSLMDECCCTDVCVANCCCEPDSFGLKLPAFREPVTITIVDVVTSEDDDYSDSDVTCIIGDWVLPFVEYSVNNECIWENTFTAGSESGRAIFRVQVKVKYAQARDTDLACADVSIQWLSCKDCIGSIFNAKPLTLSYSLSASTKNLECNTSYPASPPEELETSSCACNEASQGDFMPGESATTCWNHPDFNNIGEVRVYEARLGEGDGATNKPTLDLDFINQIVDYEKAGSGNTCEWDPIDGSPDHWDVVYPSEPPSDEENSCGWILTLESTWFSDIGPDLDLPAGYAYAPNSPSGVPLNCADQSEGEEGFFEIGIVTHIDSGNSWPVEAKFAWYPDNRDTCELITVFTIPEIPCPEEPNIPDGLCECSLDMCLGGDEYPLGGAGQRAVPNDNYPSVGGSTNLCNDYDVEITANPECGDFETKYWEPIACGCARAIVRVPVRFFSDDDAPYGANYMVRYNINGLSFYLTYSKQLVDAAAMWIARWSPPLELIGYSYVPFDPEVPGSSTMEYRQTWVKDVCTCKKKLCDVRTVISEMGWEVEPGPVPANTLAPGGIRFAVSDDPNDTPGETALTWQALAVQAPPAGITDPCCGSLNPYGTCKDVCLCTGDSNVCPADTIPSSIHTCGSVACNDPQACRAPISWTEKQRDMPFYDSEFLPFNVFSYTWNPDCNNGCGGYDLNEKIFGYDQDTDTWRPRACNGFEFDDNGCDKECYSPPFSGGFYQPPRTDGNDVCGDSPESFCSDDCSFVSCVSSDDLAEGWWGLRGCASCNDTELSSQSFGYVITCLCPNPDSNQSNPLPPISLITYSQYEMDANWGQSPNCKPCGSLNLSPSITADFESGCNSSESYAIFSGEFQMKFRKTVSSSLPSTILVYFIDTCGNKYVVGVNPVNPINPGPSDPCGVDNSIVFNVALDTLPNPGTSQYGRSCCSGSTLTWSGYEECGGTLGSLGCAGFSFMNGGPSGTRMIQSANACAHENCNSPIYPEEPLCSDPLPIGLNAFMEAGIVYETSGPILKGHPGLSWALQNLGLLS